MKLKALLSPWLSNADGLADVEINNVHNDSRKIQPNGLFFAYPGAQTDGRKYISDAQKAGAVVVIYEPSQGDFKLPEGIIAIPMPELGRHLAAIVSRFYNNPSANKNVIGVTGTNGKTTIAFQLAQAHDKLGVPTAYIGTLGQGKPSQLTPLVNTTPDGLCLQGLFSDYTAQGIQQVCMEVSSHALSLGRVEAVDFKQALFTNLTLDHLDYHKTMETYAAAKASLFAHEGLDYAIINQDDSYASQMSASLKKGSQLISYGLGKEAQVKAVNWQSTLLGTEINLISPWGATQLHTKSLGLFNVYNTLAIFTSLMASGYSLTKVTEVIALLYPAPGRMEIVTTAPCVIVDYAHTPDALANVLMTFAAIKQGRILVVFGCGGDRDKSKRPIMGKIATEKADFAILTSDNPRTEDPLQIIEDIEAGVAGPNYYKIPNREDAIIYALSLAKANDIVLIAGKGHENYQQIGLVQHKFSDQEIARRHVKNKSSTQ